MCVCVETEVQVTQVTLTLLDLDQDRDDEDLIYIHTLTEFSRRCFASCALQPTTCGQPLKANSSSSASILSFSSGCAASTTCFSLNCTWAKWEVRASREEFSSCCSSSSLLNLAAVSSMEAAAAEEEEAEEEAGGGGLCGAAPRPGLSSSGVATAPTGAQRSPAAPGNDAPSLSDVDNSSVDIFFFFLSFSLSATNGNVCVCIVATDGWMSPPPR